MPTRRSETKAPAAARGPAEFASYLESLPEPHILFDTRYRIVAANAAYRAQFAPRASVLGRTCYEVSHHIAVPCDQAGEACPLARSRESGQRERVLHLHHTPQGEAYVSIELVPVRDAAGTAAWFIERMEPLRMAHGAASAEGLIGRSAPFREMLELVARVGPSEASVLLAGESGTGKELVARAVHEASARAGRPLVVVDCASLPETLFESELFGHEKGAFTGAHAAKAGLVEAAHGGTLFLDEVGDIPLTMQVKLLRLLESGTYRRVGSTELRRADVRLVSATHRDLHALIAAGRFREDLYHRLATFPIALPPLRERRGDIPLLAASLLARVAPERTLLLAPAALTRLAQHPFPGNVRELRNLMDYCAATVAEDEVRTEHLPPRFVQGVRSMSSGSSPPSGLSPAQSPSAATPGGFRRIADEVQELEARRMREALDSTAGNQRRAAERIGMPLRTFVTKLKQYGLREK